MSNTVKPLILMYHRIADLRTAERYTVSPQQFARQMRYLRDHGYRVINFSALMDWLNRKTPLSERSVIITFDDGFMDTYQHACPVLCNYGFSATFFVISGLVGKTSVWLDGPGDRSSPLMGWRELENLRDSGLEVGSHTENHRDLTILSDCNAKDEIEKSKGLLEDRLGVAVNIFAYPYGRYQSTALQLVCDAGYYAACATTPGFVTLEVDRYQLPRLEVAGSDSLWSFAHKVKFGFKRFTSLDLMRYYARRVTAHALGN